MTPAQDIIHRYLRDEYQKDSKGNWNKPTYEIWLESLAIKHFYREPETIIYCYSCNIHPVDKDGDFCEHCIKAFGK